MNNKEHFDMLVGMGVLTSDLAESRVRVLAERLLSALKIPDEEGMALDKARIEHFGIDINECVNWASMNVGDIKELVDGTFLIWVDEACPDTCPTLCAYVEKYMTFLGWQVSVRTMW